MDLDEKYEELINFFGKENVTIEYFTGEDLALEGLDPMELMKRMFSNVKLTHIPSGKIVMGTSSNTQIENAISALMDLKAQLS